MKTPNDPKEEVALLDAILADADWDATQAAMQRKAAVSLRGHRRRRNLWAWTCRAGLVAVLAGACWWHWRPRTDGMARLPEDNAHASAPRVVIRSFTDEQLLGMFPEGSCLIAEVDGKPKLIVLDEARAEGGFRFP
jgi:hypothetical protein